MLKLILTDEDEFKFAEVNLDALPTGWNLRKAATALAADAEVLAHIAEVRESEVREL
jgi:hypothetical protein